MNILSDHEIIFCLFTAVEFFLKMKLNNNNTRILDSYDYNNVILKARISGFRFATFQKYIREDNSKREQ